MKHDHKHLPSSPVIPFDDPTILFANAGMNQFKDIFTGEKKPDYPRATTSQKCMRAGGKHNDLENVGRTGRHQTFFEMLGNFSFGDYFKEEAIFYCWEWVTKYLDLSIDRLYATVYDEDDEAYSIWAKVAPELKNGRILKFGRQDNYWSMGNIGPCGPCSELHYDQGDKFGTGPNDNINGEGDRFVEIWNLVFMQFEQKADGNLVPLPKPSVDTGAGLERVTCVKNGLDSNYETDLFVPLIESIAEITGKKYHSDVRGVSHRVIADHVRALTFCIADGGGLSNEKQGYVLRRILRRAARHGRLIDMHDPFIYKLVPTLADLMGDVYPEINDRREHIVNVIRAEEESFGRTLDIGCDLFDEVVNKLKREGGTVISGDDVFKLYDTYGFPVDLINVMAEEKGLTLDMDIFDKSMNRQKEQSRGASQFDGERDVFFQTALKERLEKSGQTDFETKFVRDSMSIQAKVLFATKLTHAESGETYLALIPDRTPLYVESGGQLSDHGSVSFRGNYFYVRKLLKIDKATVHICDNPDACKITAGQQVAISTDMVRRRNIIRNHTATHLLQAALREVLGEHVFQSGSYVGPDKLRFDFSHFQPLTDEQITEVEKRVNDKILRALNVVPEEDVAIEEAKEQGAMAIFGEKYSDRVRVVRIHADETDGTIEPEYFSQELCGGTHVDNTAQIGSFMITLETGIASGVRRIEAVTGRMAVEKMLSNKQTVDLAVKLFNKPENEIASALEDASRRLLSYQKEIKKLKSERFSAGGGTTVGEDKKIGSLVLRFHDFGEVDSVEMSGWVDSIKGSAKPEIAAAIGKIDGKMTFMSSGSSATGIHIGKLTGAVLKQLGGRGGGKENFARGSVPETVDSNEVFDVLQKKLREELE